MTATSALAETREWQEVSTQAQVGRWSKEQAANWYDQQPWLCGFNYLPSNAVNFVAMWHPETFDPERIAEELGWASALGYNTLRVNVQFALWAVDPEGTRARLDQFLDIAFGAGMSTMVCLFDDCEFSGAAPTAVVQPAPVPGLHNSRALASPGRDAVMDRSQWQAFEEYVADVVGAFRDDHRVLAWDIYNEPGNCAIFVDPITEGRYDPSLGDQALLLAAHAFGWVRACEPTQPLTAAAWQLPHSWETPNGLDVAYENDSDKFLVAASDIVSFHAYCPRDWFDVIISRFRAHGRPVLCTEWLARPASSRFEDQLPMMKSTKVASYHWGFVNGASQTHFAWPALKARLVGTPDADTWFHDVLRSDGTPYSDTEMSVLRNLTQNGSAH